MCIAGDIISNSKVNNILSYEITCHMKYDFQYTSEFYNFNNIPFYLRVIRSHV